MGHYSRRGVCKGALFLLVLLMPLLLLLVPSCLLLLSIRLQQLSMLSHALANCHHQVILPRWRWLTAHVRQSPHNLQQSMEGG